MPSPSEVKADYVSGAAAAGGKLVDRYTKVTDKLAKASSDAAQKSYAEAMRDPKVLQRRQNNLKKLSEEDLNKAMRDKGGAAYSAGVAAGADKWEKNVAPYFTEIDNISRALPARTRDPATNVTNRVTPFAVGLRKKKDSMS